MNRVSSKTYLGMKPSLPQSKSMTTSDEFNRYILHMLKGNDPDFTEMWVCDLGNRNDDIDFCLPVQLTWAGWDIILGRTAIWNS